MGILRSFVVLSLASTLFVGHSQTTSFTLADPNQCGEFTVINIAGYSTSACAGLADLSWTCGGGDPLYQSWWWYRIGSSREYALSNLTSYIYDSQYPDRITLVYVEGDLEFTLRYFFTSNATCRSAGIRVCVEVKNTSNQNLTVSLFHYSNWNLSGTANNDRSSYFMGTGKEWLRQIDVETQDVVFRHILGWQDWEQSSGSYLIAELIDNSPTQLEDTDVFLCTTDVKSAIQRTMAISPSEVIVGIVMSEDYFCESLHGDVDGDGCVDDTDLLLVLFADGQSGCLPEDLDNSGTVDGEDLLIVLFKYASCDRDFAPSANCIL